MEEINLNAILEFNDNQLFDVRKALGYKDVNKLKQNIEKLDDWIKQQNHFKIKVFDKGYLERMLIYNKGSLERTKQEMDKLCTCVNLMPEFLQNCNRNKFTYMFNVMNVCVLPKPSKENYRIVITNANGVDESRFTRLSYYRYYIVLAQYMLHNDYCFGYEAIADLRNNVGKINPIIIYKDINFKELCSDSNIANIKLWKELAQMSPLECLVNLTKNILECLALLNLYV